MGFGEFVLRFVPMITEYQYLSSNCRSGTHLLVFLSHAFACRSKTCASARKSSRPSISCTFPCYGVLCISCVKLPHAVNGYRPIPQPLQKPPAFSPLIARAAFTISLANYCVCSFSRPESCQQLRDILNRTRCYPFTGRYSFSPSR